MTTTDKKQVDLAEARDLDAEAQQLTRNIRTARRRLTWLRKQRDERITKVEDRYNNGIREAQLALDRESAALTDILMEIQREAGTPASKNSEGA